jgi:hypothetical protein
MSWKDVLKFMNAPEGHDVDRWEYSTNDISEGIQKVMMEVADFYFDAESSMDNFNVADIAHELYLEIYRAFGGWEKDNV